MYDLKRKKRFNEVVCLGERKEEEKEGAKPKHIFKKCTSISSLKFKICSSTSPYPFDSPYFNNSVLIDC